MTFTAVSYRLKFCSSGNKTLSNVTFLAWTSDTFSVFWEKRMMIHIHINILKFLSGVYKAGTHFSDIFNDY